MRKRDIALGIAAAVAGAGPLMVAFSGVLKSVCLYGAILIGTGALLSALGRAMRHNGASIGVLIVSVGILLAVPGVLGVIEGCILVPVDRNVELLVGIGSLFCAIAGFFAGIGKLKGIRWYVDLAYPLYGVGAIQAGLGCLIFCFHRGIRLAVADVGSGVLVAGLIGGLALGLVAFAALFLGMLRRSIYVPSGSKIRPVLIWIYSKKTFSRVFEPVLAETQNEWLEAQAAGRYWQARWITVRGDLLLLRNILLQVPSSVVKIIIQFWKLGP